MKKHRVLTFFALLVLGLVAATVAYEYYTRTTTTYVAPIRYRQDPLIGPLYDHESSPTRINALGFNDFPRNPAAGGKRRILLVGDSFVSGSPVTDTLEYLLNAQAGGDRPFEVVPMAYPGIGMGTMYTYVQRLGLQFHPELVVVIFNSSTFANNSALLNAIKHRQLPDHPQLVFFNYLDGQCSRSGISPETAEYQLKSLPSYKPTTFYTVLQDRMEKHLSRFYLFNWLKDSVAHDDGKSFLYWDAEFAYRYAQLRATPAYDELLRAWNFPDDLDMNSMFWTATEQMPGVFRNAMDCTECALKDFDALARDNGFRFLLVVTDDCSELPTAGRREFAYRNEKAKRPFVEQGYKAKIVSLAQKTGTRYLDLYEDFGADSPQMHGFDAHWNTPGLRRAAAAIAKAVWPMLQPAP